MFLAGLALKAGSASVVIKPLSLVKSDVLVGILIPSCEVVLFPLNSTPLTEGLLVSCV